MAANRDYKTYAGSLVGRLNIIYDNCHNRAKPDLHTRDFASSDKAIRYGIIGITSIIESIQEEHKKGSIKNPFEQLKQRLAGYDPRESNAVSEYADNHSYISIDRIKSVVLEYVQKQEIPSIEQIKGLGR